MRPLDTRGEGGSRLLIRVGRATRPATGPVWKAGERSSLAGSTPAPSAPASMRVLLLIDGVRGVTEAHENVNLKAPGSTPAEHPHRFPGMEAMMTSNVLELPTLVLNQQWQPVHVTTVARSLILLWNDAARVVDPDEYRLFSWSDWAERQPADGEPCIRSARLRLRGPRGDHPVALRPAAEHGGHVQPAQRRQA